MDSATHLARRPPQPRCIREHGVEPEARHIGERCEHEPSAVSLATGRCTLRAHHAGPHVFGVCDYERGPVVDWEYEDRMPVLAATLSVKDALRAASQVDKLRLFPFVEIDGERFYLLKVAPG